MTHDVVEDNPIRAAMERIEARIVARPGLGSATKRSVSTIGDGLRCSTQEDSWTFATDLPRALGGTAEAPSPGVLARASLGSCLAIMYAMRAARHGLTFSSITVTIEADSDVAGMLFDDSSVAAGFEDVRYHVDIESDDDQRSVELAIDEADRLSPLLDVFRRANSLSRTVAVHKVVD